MRLHRTGERKTKGLTPILHKKKYQQLRGECTRTQEPQCREFREKGRGGGEKGGEKRTQVRGGAEGQPSKRYKG